ncbi:MAG: aromatic amino acid transport family protein [Patescibacteria group bacterium]
MKRKFRFIKALACFAGTIIGVGFFCLPYVARQAGFFVVVAYFILMSGIVIVIHSLLGEVTCDTHRVARIPGYAEEYLGKRAKKISFTVSLLSLAGALLAYLIMGGEFLYLLLSPLIGGAVIYYILAYFILGSIIIYRDRCAMVPIQLILGVVFVLILLFFFFRGLPYVHLNNLATFDYRFLTMPYGVILFSLWGITLVPEVKEIVDRNRKKLFKVIGFGIIISAICYLLFTFTILGVSGTETTNDAILGFSKIIDPRLIYLGFLLGLITTFTSFISIGTTLKKIFWYDLKLSKKKSWAFACFIPLALYLLGFKNCIDVIGLTGGIFLGLEGIIVILIYQHFVKKRFQYRIPFFTYLLIILLLLGMVSEIAYLFIR